MPTASEIVINVQEIEPRLRHQTIFDTFESLEEGQYLVIHNNHDPVPVRFQMLDLYGEIFSWEYLSMGPEWWDVRVTRLGEPQMDFGEGVKVIDVPSLEPRMKHPTIFNTYEGLKVGESLVIHNNHDPQPVYYQMLDYYGQNFDWEYLDKGPQWWNIKVTKKAELPDAGSDEEGVEEVLLVNVPLIEPHLKHDTIFQVFENCEPGERFIIRNDHDPKPLYYQLQARHGEVFTWEYMQEGPEVWEILVTLTGPLAKSEETEKPAAAEKVEAPQQEESSEEGGPDIADSTIEAMRPGEIIIDVPAIEPHSKKHDQILATFDELHPGESFIIHNDHDPKPLYYQLKAMHGDVFDWEYLVEGPKHWDVRVSLRKEEENAETIGEIVTKDISKAEIFKKFGIDFCCGGEKTVRQACREMGIDPTEVEKELHKPETVITGGANLNYSDWSPDFLADYIVNAHHTYAKKYLPEIWKYAQKVASVHGGHHPELLEVRDLVDQVSKDLPEHMKEEEEDVFPTIKEIVKGNFDKGGKEAFKKLVDEQVQEHESVGEKMKEIHKLTDGYTLPGDACASYTLLFKMLSEFENDLFTHIHLENNILFPKAVEMTESL